MPKFLEEVAMMGLATLLAGVVVALILWFSRRAIWVWWTARQWICAECGEEVPRWFGHIEYHIVNGKGESAALVCAVCEGYAQAYSSPITFWSWVPARWRAWRRLQVPHSAAPVKEDPALQKTLNKAMRDIDRNRLAAIRARLK